MIYATYDGAEFQMISVGPQFGGFGFLLGLSPPTVDLGTIPTHNVGISGVGTITSFGASAIQDLPIYNIIFSGGQTLVHSSTLDIPGGATVVTQPGDSAIAFYVGPDGTASWKILSYSRSNGTALVSPTPLCGFKGLTIATNGTPTTISWQWAAAELLTPFTNLPVFSSNQMGNVITTATGAGGIDSPVSMINRFIYLYGIYSESALQFSAIGSGNPPSTGPTLPAGYTHLCYMGAVRTDASGNLMNLRIVNNIARYLPAGGATGGLPLVIQGASTIGPTGTGCNATPTYVSIQIAGNVGAAPILIPSTAIAADLIANNTWLSGGPITVLVAPDANYGSMTASSNNQNPPPLSATANGSMPQAMANLGRLLLESSSIYICIAGNAGAIQAYGWVDAVNAN
jgi:hypothetical protein